MENISFTDRYREPPKAVRVVRSEQKFWLLSRAAQRDLPQ